MIELPDHDSRARVLKNDDYYIKSRREGEVWGLILCSRPGVSLIDFYRTSPVLAKDVVPKARICVACKCEISGTVAYTDQMNPICQPCARKRTGL